MRWRVAATDRVGNTTRTDASVGKPGEQPFVLTITNKADLSLAKSVDDASPSFGDVVTFSVAIFNTTSSIDATGVEAKDLLSAGFSYVSDTPSSGTYNSGTGI